MTDAVYAFVKRDLYHACNFVRVEDRRAQRAAI